MSSVDAAAVEMSRADLQGASPEEGPYESLVLGEIESGVGGGGCRKWWSEQHRNRGRMKESRKDSATLFSPGGSLRG